MVARLVYGIKEEGSGNRSFLNFNRLFGSKDLGKRIKNIYQTKLQALKLEPVSLLLVNFFTIAKYRVKFYEKPSLAEYS
jgi:hypothetical protein